MENYPKSPEITGEITKLPTSYYLKALLAVLAIVLFFVLYFSFIYFLVQLNITAFNYDIGHVNKFTLLGKFGAVTGSLMLLIFSLKFIFKLKNHKPENRIKLSKTEHPKIWAFILKVCEETKAPKPKHIYVDPDVNAYVRYTNTWLSLFLPIKKELTVGLGLVSTLNISEFKAVMSHEFGHFSQKSMTIGSYIMSANTIIHDMIYTRDRWDDLLDKWKSLDFRVSFIAWIMTPIIWVIRQILSLFYQLLNIMYSLLSQEMEFNADKVAVQTSGSDAIVSGLWKLEKAFEQWNTTVNNMFLASKNGKFINNIYGHLNYSWSNLTPIHNDTISNLPEHKFGGKHFFSNSENTKVSMYASHPPNNLREENAKHPYIESPINENSSWLLFDHHEALQKELTTLIYKQYFHKEPQTYISFDEFQTFIQQEEGDKALFEEYSNSFKSRYLLIPKIELLKEKAILIGVETGPYFDELKAEAKILNYPVLEIQNKLQDVNDWFNKIKDFKTIEYDDKSYSKKDLENLYQLLQKDMEDLFREHFIEWDIKFFASHYALAKANGNEEEYHNLIQQQYHIDHFSKTIMHIHGSIIQEINHIQTKEDVEDSDLIVLKTKVNNLFFKLNTVFSELFSESPFMPLPNITTLDELKAALIDGGEFKKRTGEIFKDGQFDEMMLKMEQSIQLCDRVSKKNLQSLLVLHKQLYKHIE